jgi:hypothetical protein
MPNFFSHHTNQLVGFISTIATVNNNNILRNGEIKMTQKIGTDTNSSAPIHLDSEQLEELDKLINNLKKEVVAPRKTHPETTATSGAESA